MSNDALSYRARLRALLVEHAYESEPEIDTFLNEYEAEIAARAAVPDAEGLRAARGYPVVSDDKDGGSIGWAPDPLGAYVRWSDIAALASTPEAEPRREHAADERDPLQASEDAATRRSPFDVATLLSTGGYAPEALPDPRHCETCGRSASEPGRCANHPRNRAEQDYAEGWGMAG
jgi:hypothetical protein